MAKKFRKFPKKKSLGQHVTLIIAVLRILAFLVGMIFPAEVANSEPKFKILINLVETLTKSIAFSDNK